MGVWGALRGGLPEKGTFGLSLECQRVPDLVGAEGGGDVS